MEKILSGIGYCDVRPRRKYLRNFRIELPALGNEMPNEGGRFGGIIFNYDGEPSEIIIVGEISKAISFPKAVGWLKKLNASQDFKYKFPAIYQCGIPALYGELIGIPRGRYWLEEAADGKGRWSFDVPTFYPHTTRQSDHLFAMAIRVIPLGSKRNVFK